MEDKQELSGLIFGPASVDDCNLCQLLNIYSVKGAAWVGGSPSAPLSPAPWRRAADATRILKRLTERLRPPAREPAGPPCPETAG